MLHFTHSINPLKTSMLITAVQFVSLHMDTISAVAKCIFKEMKEGRNESILFARGESHTPTSVSVSTSQQGAKQQTELPTMFSFPLKHII